MFWNPVSPVQVSDLVLTGIGALKDMSIGLFFGIGASLIVAAGNQFADSLGVIVGL